MAEKVLITGGTGLVGTRLSQLLQERGYAVSFLTRNANKRAEDGFFQWDVAKGDIQQEAVEQADHIVHLAGAGVADERWTPQRKKVILDSRIQSTALLEKTLQSVQHQVKSFVSASAIGIYGNSGAEVVDEEAPHADDFLAQVCVKWEHAVDAITALDIRTVKIRIGVVLSEHGGALPQLLTPVKLFVGAPLGSGEQYMSWIHIDDLCGIFIKAITDGQLSGVYNGVAPNAVTNEALTQAIAQKVHRPVFPINVPPFALKLMMGEMSGFILGGSNVSAQKIEQAGYRFQYPNVSTALDDLLKK